MPPPKTVCCHICGKKFFKHSLPIHLKKCEEMWHKTRSECKKCGQMVHKADWSDHNRHCKKVLPKAERENVSKRPPKAIDDNRSGNISPEEAAALIEAGSLPTLAPLLDARKECKVCCRKFNPDRIDKHTRICFERSQKKKKRKTWDGHKKRVENTDFAQYSGKHRPKTPEIIDQWKKYGRRWRKETQDFRKIIHADDLDYVPPPIHPLIMARIKKATATLSARRKASDKQEPSEDLPIKKEPTFSPKIVEKKMTPRVNEFHEKAIKRESCKVTRVPKNLKTIEPSVNEPEEEKVESEPIAILKKTEYKEVRRSARRERLPPKKLDMKQEPAKRNSGRGAQRLEPKRDAAKRSSRRAARAKARMSKQYPTKSRLEAQRKRGKNLEMHATKAPQRRQRVETKKLLKPRVPRRRKTEVEKENKTSRTQKPAVPRARKPGVPRLSNRSGKRQKQQQKKEEIKAKDIATISDPTEKLKKLDELLSRRAPKATANPEPAKKAQRRRKPIANAGHSIIGESKPKRPKVYQGARLGKRGAEFREDPSYQAPSKKLSMEEYRNREKFRRRQSSSSRSYSRPSSIPSTCEKTPPAPRREMAEISTNVSESSASRKLSRKIYWEPQAIGGKKAPKNNRELRQRRANYFENLLKST